MKFLAAQLQVHQQRKAFKKSDSASKKQALSPYNCSPVFSQLHQLMEAQQAITSMLQLLRAGWDCLQ